MPAVPSWHDNDRACIVPSFRHPVQGSRRVIYAAVDREQIVLLKTILGNEPSIERVDRLLTMQLGPDSVLLAASVQFKRDIRMGDIELATERLERNINQRCPAIRHVFFGY